MFAQQQTQQLVGSARTRVVSSRYVFHIEEHANEEREISFVLWILSFSNFKRGEAVDVDSGSQFPFRAFLGQRNDIKKEYVKQKGKRKGRTRKRRLSRLVRKRERERTRRLFLVQRVPILVGGTNLFSFFLPNCLSGMDKFSFLSHKILTKYHSLSNATI